LPIFEEFLCARKLLKIGQGDIWLSEQMCEKQTRKYVLLLKPRTERRDCIG
jgi:hypothetical protein